MLLYFLKDLAPCCGRTRRASGAAALKEILVEGGVPVSRNLPYQIENALDA